MAAAKGTSSTQNAAPAIEKVSVIALAALSDNNITILPGKEAQFTPEEAARLIANGHAVAVEPKG